MKKSLLTAIAILICACSFAQYPVRRDTPGYGHQTPASRPARHGSRRTDRSFLDIHFTYSPTKLQLKKLNLKDKTSYNSVGGGFDYNLSFFHTPLYFDVGLDFRYSWRNAPMNLSFPLTTSTALESGSKFFDISIPFGLLYKIHFGNTRIALAPYIGLDADIFALGKFTKAVSKSEEFNTDIFKEQYAANRFVFGWHTGGKLFLGRIFLGIGYEGPLSHFVRNSDGSSTDFHYCDIRLGLCF